MLFLLTYKAKVDLAQFSEDSIRNILLEGANNANCKDLCLYVDKSPEKEDGNDVKVITVSYIQNGKINDDFFDFVFDIIESNCAEQIDCNFFKQNE